MKIVSLKGKRKGLTAVLLEDGRELLLDTEIVIANSLTPGIVLDDPDKLLFESDVKRAKSRALWYLSRGDLSRKKLREKLIAGGFILQAAEIAVERMVELSLVDDTRLAQRLYEYLSESGASKREILYKLQYKGIPADIAKQVIEADASDESDKLKNLIKTKYAKKLHSEENVKKVFGALIRKGYNYSDVREALKAYSEELENSEEF